jgi:glucans biosynthesis protein
MTVPAMPAHRDNSQRRPQFFDTRERAAQTAEQPSAPALCGARTRAGSPCDRAPEPGRRRCGHHGGAPGTGAPAGNTNAQKHGRYSAKSRELRARGRLLIRAGDLKRAQLAVMNARAHGDPRRVELAEERVSRCMQRLAKAAVSLDRVLVERGDEDGRTLVEGALRLAAATCRRPPLAPPSTRSGTRRRP